METFRNDPYLQYLEASAFSSILSVETQINRRSTKNFWTNSGQTLKKMDDALRACASLRQREEEIPSKTQEMIDRAIEFFSRDPKRLIIAVSHLSEIDSNYDATRLMTKVGEFLEAQKQ